MRTLIITLLIVLSTCGLKAQGLFFDFISGEIHLKNGEIRRGPLNFDTNRQKFITIENGNRNYEVITKNVEKIVIYDRVFIPARGNFFYEEFEIGGKKVYAYNRVVYEDLKPNMGFIGVGSLGTLGIESGPHITHRVGLFTSLDAPSSAGVERSQYYYRSGNSYRIINGYRDVSKVFGHEKEVSSYAIKNSIDFSNRYDVEKILEYAASL